MITVLPDQKVLRLDTPPVLGQVSYDVVVDIYSDVKEQWLNTEAYTRLIFPFRPLGGDPLGGSLFLGKYVFIRNDLGWHIHPFDSDHQVTILGNLYQQDPDGRVIFEPQGTGKTINVIQERSSLTQLAEVPVSGLTADEALDLARIRKAMLNERYTDPATGEDVILDDDDSSVISVANIYEDVAKTVTYRGTGVERRERHFST